MTTSVAGVEIPATAAAAAATEFAMAHTNRLIFDHSRRVYLFGAMLAADAGLEPDLELLYVASMMHDAGLFKSYSARQQRFEVDGADHARDLLLRLGFSSAQADEVWMAIALHTTPGLPERRGAEVAATSMGVLVDAVGVRYDSLDPVRVDEVLAAHPRAGFKEGFLRAFRDGLSTRPATTYGTINADVLAYFDPGFQRANTVDRILGSPWKD